MRHLFSGRDAEEARVLALAGANAERFFRARQVHGRTVRPILSADCPADLSRVEADALVASVEGDAVGVLTADCVPILVADPVDRRVAAVHAGWRGVVADVLGAALDALVACGSAPDRLLVAIGPHIRVCCFEVGEDVARELESVGAAVDRSHPRPHVDLVSALRRTLAARGVREADDVGGCTMCESARFHSHRREGSRAGRHISLVVAG